MKKWIAILLAALLLAALPMAGMAAGRLGSGLENLMNVNQERPAINFMDIPWLSSMEEVRDLMAASGLINEGGVNRFNQVISHAMPHGGILLMDEEEGAYVSESVSSSQLTEAMMMSSMITAPVFGHDVHNIRFTFYLNGETTQLIDVTVSYMAGQNLDDLPVLMETQYGKGRQNGDYGTLWLGADNIGLLYDFGALEYGRLDAETLIAEE